MKRGGPPSTPAQMVEDDDFETHRAKKKRKIERGEMVTVSPAPLPSESTSSSSSSSLAEVAKGSSPPSLLDLPIEMVKIIFGNLDPVLAAPLVAMTASRFTPMIHTLFPVLSSPKASGDFIYNAVEGGYIELVRFGLDHGYPIGLKAVRAAFMHGHLEILKTIQSHTDLTKIVLDKGEQKTAAYYISTPNVIIADWFAECSYEARMIWRGILEKTIRGGHLAVLMWALSHLYMCGAEKLRPNVRLGKSGGEMTIPDYERQADSYAIAALMSNNVEMVEFIFMGVRPDPTRIHHRNYGRIAAKNRNAPLVKWLFAKGFIIDPKAYGLIAKYGDLDLLKFLYKNSRQEVQPHIGLKHASKYIDDRILNNAIQSQHMEIIKWIVTVRLPVTRQSSRGVCALATEKGHLDLVKFLYANQYSLDDQTLGSAIQSGDGEMTRWVIETLMSQTRKRGGLKENSPVQLRVTLEVGKLLFMENWKDQVNLLMEFKRNNVIQLVLVGFSDLRVLAAHPDPDGWQLLAWILGGCRYNLDQHKESMNAGTGTRLYEMGKLLLAALEHADNPNMIDWFIENRTKFRCKRPISCEINEETGEQIWPIKTMFEYIYIFAARYGRLNVIQRVYQHEHSPWNLHLYKQVQAFLLQSVDFQEEDDDAEEVKWNAEEDKKKEEKRNAIQQFIIEMRGWLPDTTQGTKHEWNLK